MNRKEF